MISPKRKPRKPKADADKGQADIVHWPISRPKPYPANPRKITDKAVSKVARSIEEFGFQQPIVVDTQGVIIAGHTRLAAAEQLSLAEVPVIVADLPETKARAYRLADNRTAQETSWLDDLLGEEFDILDKLDFDLSVLGFESEELALLMNGTEFAMGSADDQGSLDELSPKIVECPHCNKQFDLRDVQG